MKLKNICIIAIIAISCIMIPLLLDWFIFGNEIYSNISNSDWASFLGGYIGALVGAVISLIGIIWTIRFTRKENSEDRRLQVAPCLNITFWKTEKLGRTNNYLDAVMYREKDIDEMNLYGILTLKNIGFGPMIDCCISDVRYKGELFPRPVQALEANALESGKQWDISIGIGTVSGEIPKDLLYEDDHKRIRPKPEALVSGELQFMINYKDIIDTPYIQTITIAVDIGAKRDNDEPWNYSASLFLRSVTPRKIAKEPTKNKVVPIEIIVNPTKIV